jgi:hypothetical protein
MKFFPKNVKNLRPVLWIAALITAVLLAVVYVWELRVSTNVAQVHFSSGLRPSQLPCNQTKEVVVEEVVREVVKEVPAQAEGVSLASRLSSARSLGSGFCGRDHGRSGVEPRVWRRGV